MYSALPDYLQAKQANTLSPLRSGVFVIGPFSCHLLSSAGMEFT
jgi:hypothetical protein